MAYAVYDNNRPATSAVWTNGPATTDVWTRFVFNTYAEAHHYACLWLGPYSYVILGFNKPFKIDYSGYGDFIEIREEE